MTGNLSVRDHTRLLQHGGVIIGGVSGDYACYAMRPRLVSNTHVDSRSRIPNDVQAEVRLDGADETARRAWVTILVLRISYHRQRRGESELKISPVHRRRESPRVAAKIRGPPHAAAPPRGRVQKREAWRRRVVLVCISGIHNGPINPRCLIACKCEPCPCGADGKINNTTLRGAHGPERFNYQRSAKVERGNWLLSDQNPRSHRTLSGEGGGGGENVGCNPTRVRYFSARCSRIRR